MNKPLVLLAVLVAAGAVALAPASTMAQQPNLTYEYHPSFAYPVFPTTTYPTPWPITLPATLPGNSSTVYWNAVGWNSGTGSTDDPVLNLFLIDGEPSYYWETGSPVAPGASYSAWDEGPINVRGGRHTFEIHHDFQDREAESDETDNVWAHQFVFTPYVLSVDTPKSRGTPPDRLGGASSIVDGSPYDFNSDGFRFTSTGWWNAITLYTDDDTADYDLELHDPSTGSENGFIGSTIGSFNFSGQLDALIVNRNVVGIEEYDVGVINQQGTGWSTIEQVGSQPANVGLSMDVTFGTDEYLHIWDTYIGDTGWVTVAVTDSTAGGENFFVGWIDHDVAETSLSYKVDWLATDYNGEARLHRNFTVTGYYGLVVFRHPGGGGLPDEISVRIEPTPPDLVPSGLPGWNAPLVPTPVPVTGGMLPELPDTLHGFAPETYFNLSVLNDSNAGSPAVDAGVYFDGILDNMVPYQTPSMGPLDIMGINDTAPQEIPGGRHTLTVVVDHTESIHEIYETNNFYGEQFCWSPLELRTGLQFSHPSPGPASGGVTTISGGPSIFYNCDGYRLPTGYCEFEGVVLTQGPTSDYDLSIHYPLVGVKDGFNDNLGRSSLWPGENDYVIFNNLRLPTMYHDIGVENFQGSDPYTIEAVGSYNLLIPVEGTYGPNTMPISNMLHLYSIYLEADLYAFRLDNISGAADWSLALHPNNVDYIARQQVLGSATSDNYGPGGPEFFSENIPSAGFYCLAVCKSDPLSFDQEGVYSLTIMRGVSDTPDEPDLPAATAMTGVHPNPFNPQTTISYELAAPAEVELAVFDMKGARVRRLVSGSIPAGRHTAVWNGKDEYGRRAASGVYLATFEAGLHRDVQKLVLVK